ncbi:MAG: nucleoside triphosphate pyrophosphohydrolase [Gammaproteobacteria bacterium]
MPAAPATDNKDFENLSPMEKLLRVMAMLRHPRHGCPWDLEQSIESLLPYTLEEAYEVADAIEQGDRVELQDELGDLMFQVVFYAQLAAEEGCFNFDDVAGTITDKLLRRHPHVFPGGDVANFGQQADLSAAQVVVNWEQIKQAERAAKEQRGSRGEDEPGSILADVPRALPALERAHKLQSRAATVGFDWSEIKPVLAKLREELDEFEQALHNDHSEQLQHELGDILFAAVNLARHSKVEPEVALRQANRRFTARFNWIERRLQEQGKSLQQCSLAALDELWEEAKRQESENTHRE